MKITVCGKSGEGKSAVMQTILKCLQEAGLDAEVEFTTSTVLRDPLELKRTMYSLVHVHNTHITIVEEQEVR